MNELIEKLRDHGLIDGSGYIVLEHYPNGGCQAVEVETFASMFGGAIEGAQEEQWYGLLAAADGGRGYLRFFDAWKYAGIL